MPLITVDPEKCKRDGICAAECPAKIISFKDKKSVPVPVNGAEEMCIDCGHCVAVCPTAALSHKNYDAADCLPVNDEWLLGADQAEHFLRYRRSIRTFKSEPVEREILARLVSIASHAPSGHNMQPVSWHVTHDQEKFKEQIGMVADWMRYMIEEKPDMARAFHMDMMLAAWDLGVDVICRNAPHIIIAHGTKGDPNAGNACVIAMTYLDLAAPSLDLGSCWAGFYNMAATYWPPLKEALGLPEKNAAYASMMIGYPKFKYHRMPPRNEPRVSWT